MQPHRGGDNAEGKPGEAGDKRRGERPGSEQDEIEGLELVHSVPHVSPLRLRSGGWGNLGRPKWLRGGCLDLPSILGQGSAVVNLASFRKFGVAGAPISTYIRRRGVIADTPSDGRSSKFCATRTARSATMDEGRFSISAQPLYERLGGPAAPILIDARRAPTF